MACKNPFLEAERARKREALLAATEAGLAKITAATQRARQPLRGKDKIALRADRVLDRRKVGSTSPSTSARTTSATPATRSPSPPRPPSMASTSLFTSVGASGLDSSEIVSSYKALAQVERAFRAFNADLDIRPIRHRTETRVRAHGCGRVVLHHLAPAGPPGTHPVHRRRQANCRSHPPQPRRPGRPLPESPGQAAAKRTADNLPVHSFDSLIADLATICLNQIQPADPALPAFRLITPPPHSSDKP